MSQKSDILLPSEVLVVSINVRQESEVHWLPCHVATCTPMDVTSRPVVASYHLCERDGFVIILGFQISHYLHVSTAGHFIQ